MAISRVSQGCCCGCGGGDGDSGCGGGDGDSGCGGGGGDNVGEHSGRERWSTGYSNQEVGSE